MPIIFGILMFAYTIFYGNTEEWEKTVKKAVNKHGEYFEGADLVSWEEYTAEMAKLKKALSTPKVRGNTMEGEALATI